MFGGMVEYGKYSNDLYELQVGDVARLRLWVQFQRAGQWLVWSVTAVFLPPLPRTHAGEPLGMEAAEG